MAQWSDNTRTFLIREVYQRKILWEKTLLADGSLKTAKLLALQDITANMNEAFNPAVPFTLDDIRTQWKNLKDTFVRKQRMVMEGRYSNDPLKEPIWKYYRMLSFLSDKPIDESHEALLELEALRNDFKSELKSSHMCVDLPPSSSPDASNQSATSSSIMAPILNQCEQLIEERDRGNKASNSSRNAPSQHTMESSTSSTDTLEPNYVVPTKRPPVERQSNDHGTESDDEPRRKKANTKRPSDSSIFPVQPQYSAPPPILSMPPTPSLNANANGGRDNFDIFGELVADQLRRLSQVRSRNVAMRLQWRISDAIRDSQNELDWS